MAKQLGYTEGDLKALANFANADNFSPAVKAAIKLAENMTVNGQLVTDEDFAELRQYYTEPELVELTSLIGMVNYFNRFTTTLRIDISGTDAPYESFEIGE
ncbi:MAG: carboxymuconolactone decarboxylase family protein [bacterium]